MATRGDIILKGLYDVDVLSLRVYFGILLFLNIHIKATLKLY